MIVQWSLHLWKPVRMRISPKQLIRTAFTRPLKPVTPNLFISMSSQICKCWIGYLQKKKDQPALHKTRKKLLIATISILLITSGIMAGISMLTHRAPTIPVLPQTPKKAAIQSAPINLSSNTAPQSQPMDTVRKVQAANNSFQVKTNQVQNDKQGLSIKNEQNKKQILKKRLPLPMISKIDSNDNPDNVDSTKKQLS